MEVSWEVSIMFARFWGALFVLSCLVFIFRKKALHDLFQMTKDKEFVVTSGYVALIIGLFTVVMHNVWVSDWRVAITIIGWISLIKGLVRLAFPEAFYSLAKSLKDKYSLLNTLLFIAIMVGFWLLWVSY